jgi:hypothetical protein
MIAAGTLQLTVELPPSSEIDQTLFEVETKTFELPN